MFHKRKLCLAIIEDHFGSVVKEVADYISLNSSNTLVSLCRYFSGHGWLDNEVREVLVLLYHHNCLSITNPVDPETNEALDTQYGLHYEHIFNRLRFSNVCNLTRHQLGEIAALVLEEVAVQGYAHISTIAEAVAGTSSHSQDEVKTIMSKLIEKRFLSAVPSWTTPPSANASTAPNSTTASISSTTPKADTSKKRKITPVLAPPEDTDNSLPVELQYLLKPSSSASAASNASSSSVTVEKGTAKRLRKASDSKQAVKKENQTDNSLNTYDSFVASNQSTKLWYINWTHLNTVELHQIIASIISQRFNKLGEAVAHIFLVDSASPNTALSTTTIFTKLQQLKADFFPAITIDITMVTKLLDLMSQDAFAVLQKQYSGTETMYCVPIESIRKQYQQVMMVGLITDKFGVAAARIFQYLQQNKYADQQKVSVATILPAKETREHIYTLFKHHFIDYIDVNKRADFMPSTSLYYWYVDYAAVVDLVIEAQYQSIFNLLARKNIEIAKNKELIDFSHTLTDAQEQKRYATLSLKVDRLDQAAQQIVDNVMMLV